jgi:hypothetical protein
MGKKFKKALGFVAAIFIPFVAPIIASTIGLSAAIGSTVGSALVGAGLGAANAAVLTGGDVGRGALMGGIGGGIRGYNYTPAATAATNMSSYTNPAALQAASPETYNVATGAYSAPVTASFVPDNMSSYTNPVAQQAAGLDTASTTAAFDPVSSSYTNLEAQQAAGFNAPPVTTDPFVATNASSYTNPAALQAASPETYNVATGAYSAPAATNMSSYTNPAALQAAGLNAAPPTTFADALKAVPGEIAAKFSDPQALADMTLRAAGALAGSLSAGDGMSNAEKALLKAQTDELRELQQTNKALFDQKLQAAQNLIGESKYFDPEYFGLQRARKAKLAGAKAKRAGLRGLTGARRASEERRFDLATGRDTGSAFDQGFQTGIAGRLQNTQAGLSGMPGYLTGSGAEYTNIYNQYAAADKRAAERAKGAGELFGSITGISSTRR